jgi:peptidoglycan/xylan/chitin deacetylase (PgdA/CDA1 family)
VALITALIVASAVVISANNDANIHKVMNIAYGQKASGPSGGVASYEVSAASEDIQATYGAFSVPGSALDAQYISYDPSLCSGSATGPAVKDIVLDADELLFGKKGAKLTIKIAATPKKADLTSLSFESSDESVATVDGNGKVKARGWGTCDITAKVGSKNAKCKVTVARKWVALTFDDGPGKPTDKLLKNLEKQDVRATFFIVGRMAKSRGSTLKKIVKNGNEIGNHTYDHDGSPHALKNGLKKTDDLVKKALGCATSLMRPPGGAINNVTRQCGKAIIMWSVDPKDWQDRDSDTVYGRVMKGTKSGSIVLLHDIHQTSADAAVRIIKSLKNKGYAFVTVSELLDGPEANEVYNKGPEKVRTMKIKY